VGTARRRPNAESRDQHQQVWLRLVASLPLLLAVPLSAWSFLVWRFACYENCTLNTLGQLLRYAQLGCAALFLYCAIRLAFTRYVAERREALLLSGASLLLWAAVFAAYYVAAPKTR
jgi:hypothetical protein